MCEVLGAPEISNNVSFVSAELRSQNRNAVNSAIEEITVTKTSQEWIDMLAQVGVPCGPIYSIDQVFDDPQVKHLEMEHPVDHPILGKLKLVGQPLKMSRYKSRKGVPTPERGQHTDEILTEIGFTESEIENFKNKNVL